MTNLSKIHNAGPNATITDQHQLQLEHMQSYT
jgi:hypothetical protein